MSFTVIAPQKAAAGLPVALSAFRGVGRGDTKTIRRLVFVIHPDIHAQLGWLPEQPVRIGWGDGDDIGRVRIAATMDGPMHWVARPYKGGNWRVSTDAIPATFGGVHYAKAGLRFTVGASDGRLDLVLPDDFYTRVKAVA